MRLAPLALFVLAGCNNQSEFHEQKRVLDSFPYVDCGAIAPGDRQICTVPLFSQEAGKLTIFDIRVEDLDYPEGGLDPEAQTAFIVRPGDWQSGECEGGDCVYLEGYDDESDDDTLALPVTFAPNAEGEYRAELTIWSNDNQTTSEEPMIDDPERTEPVWKVQLRALARPACGRVFPSFYDLGKHTAPGAEFTAEATVENCGIVTLIVSAFHEAGTGMEEMAVPTSVPLSILPGQTDTMAVAWTVGALVGGEVDPVEDVITFESNADNMEQAESFTVVGNSCADSVLDDWDADADGWTACGGDCDDDDPTANPSLTERAGNGNDDDCDGTVDEAANPVSSDDDGDGFSESAGDCDDADPAVNPAAVEVINAIDDDCNDAIDDETEWFDDDLDGYSERDGDTDDANRLVYPGAPETQDGVDNDCDGIVDEGAANYDDDQDDQVDTPVGTDCDDGDTWVHEGAFEFCDGYDNDCDGLDDEGEDDTPDGACAFLPRRKSDVIVQDPKGCASAPGGIQAGLFGGLIAVGAAALRRRRVPRVV